jgi:hypothetical protein
MSITKKLLLLGAGALLVYLAFLPPSFISWDGGGMLNVAVSVVQKHNITVDPGNGVLGRNGQYYSLWYPLLSFLSIPFVYLGLAASSVVKLPQSYIIELSALLLSALIAASNVVVTAWLALRLGATLHSATLAGIVYGFCTLAITYARNFYADPLLALTVGLALCLAFGEDNIRNLFGAASCCALAILAKPTGIVLAPVLFFYFLGRRPRSSWAIVAGAASGVFLYIAYNFARFGDVFMGGQPNHWDFLHTPIGVLGLLFSPKAGLLLFCPIVLCAFGQRPRSSREGLAIFTLSALFVLLYGAWSLWHATTWGPRFLFPAMLPLVALASLSPRRKLWLGLALLGFVMQLPTWVATPERYSQFLAEKHPGDRAVIWNPLLSPVLGMWPSAIAQFRDASSSDVLSLSVHRPSSSNLADSRFFKIVPLWWWMLPLVHVSRWLGVAVSFLVTCCGVLLMRRSVSAAPV